MKFFNHTRPKMVIADEGKHFRDKSDVYIPEYVSDKGNLIPEHYPTYSTFAFVPDMFTEEMMYELYVEEEIKE